MLIISKFQLNSSDIISGFVPRDEGWRVVVKSVWCIRAHLIFWSTIKNKANVEISFGTQMFHSFSNFQHYEVNWFLKCSIVREVNLKDVKDLTCDPISPFVVWKWDISNKKHVINFETEKEPKMKYFDFRPFQIHWPWRKFLFYWVHQSSSRWPSRYSDFHQTMALDEQFLWHHP